MPLATLATLLDLPAGVAVTSVTPAGDRVTLALDGPAVPVDVGAEEISAEYAVDTAGRRAFVCFAPVVVGDDGGITETPAPVEEQLATAQARIAALEAQLTTAAGDDASAPAPAPAAGAAAAPKRRSGAGS